MKEELTESYLEDVQPNVLHNVGIIETPPEDFGDYNTHPLYSSNITGGWHTSPVGVTDGMYTQSNMVGEFSQQVEFLEFGDDDVGFIKEGETGARITWTDTRHTTTIIISTT